MNSHTMNYSLSSVAVARLQMPTVDSWAVFTPYWLVTVSQLTIAQLLSHDSQLVTNSSHQSSLYSLGAYCIENTISSNVWLLHAYPLLRKYVYPSIASQQTMYSCRNIKETIQCNEDELKFLSIDFHFDFFCGATCTWYRTTPALMPPTVTASAANWPCVQYTLTPHFGQLHKRK